MTGKMEQVSCNTPGARTVWQLEIEKFSDDEIVVAAALQGIANRSGPKVYLSMVDRHWAMRFKHVGPFSSNGVCHSDETFRKYRSCADVWIDYYSKEYGLSFTVLNTLEELLSRSPGLAGGIIRFDRTSRAELVIASTLAGLEDALPVTDSFLEAHPAFRSLPEIADLRGRYPDAVAAQKWAAEELLPRCSRNAVYSQTSTVNEGDDDLFSLDLIVQQKLFSFNLGFWRARTPEEYELIEEILSRIEPCSPVYGWGTSEAAMMIGMARSGQFLVCTHTPNISFHAAVSGISRPFTSKRRIDPSSLSLEDKYYVSFMVNEGDTLKWMGSLMGFGSWLEQERGSLPISWGVNPWLTSKFPGMMNYFSASMSENDSFYSLIGYGYYNPKHTSQMEKLASLEVEHGLPAGLSAGSIYAVHGMIDAVNGHLDARTEEYLVRRGCRGYAFEAAQESYLKFTRAGQPIIATDWDLFYWWHRCPEGKDPVAETAKHIVELAGRRKPPYFIPVYGGSPSAFSRIAALLPREKFRIVHLDEMIELARIHGAEIAPCRAADRSPARSPGLSRIVRAPRVDNWKVDGDTGKWLKSDAVPVRHSLGSYGAGAMEAEYRWAWNQEYLYFLVEEKAPPSNPIESLDRRFYEAGEFDFVDGVAFWCDFDMDGTAERGDFTPWFGFSSRGLDELYCCFLNNKVLSSSSPKAVVSTALRGGLRMIEAAVCWREIERYLAEDHVPAGGISNAAAPGFRFGCQPLLIEGNSGRAFLNGRSNKRQNNTAAALEDSGNRTVPAPSGFDSESLTIELA